MARLCLHQLKAQRRKAKSRTAPAFPEPVFDTEGLAEAATELADDLSFALLLALNRLSPLERAAFLLHDVFRKSPFAEIAPIIDRTEPRLPAIGNQRPPRGAGRPTDTDGDAG